MIRIVIITGLLVLGGATSIAQDFRKVVEIVDEMETSLRRMIAKEQTDRSADIAGLRKEIDRLRASRQGTSPTDTMVSASGPGMAPEFIYDRLDLIEKRADEMHDGLAQLTQALSVLVGELKKSSSADQNSQTQEVMNHDSSSLIGGEGRNLETAPLRVSGLLDMSVNFNFASPADRTTALHPLDAHCGQFDVNLVKLGVRQPAEPVGFCLELGFGSITDMTNTIDGSIDQTYKYIHQAYVSAVIPVGTGLRVDAGKFLSPLGAEVVESNANWNYSRSFLFGYAVPTFHVGVKLTYPVSSSLALSAMLVNGFTRVVDNNSGKTLGAQIAWVATEALNITGNVITGPEQENNNVNIRTVWDAVVGWQAGKRLAFNINYDYGHEAVTGATAIWSGVSLMSRYTLDDRFGLALRGEWFEDRSGSQTGTTQELREVTLTWEWRVQEHWLLRGELRRDWSTGSVFPSADPAVFQTTQDTFTLSAVCEF